MRFRRENGGRRRGVVSLAVAVGAAVGLGLSVARAGDHEPRVLPPYAVQPPGASFEGYPQGSRAQRVRIAEEALGSSFGALAHRPLRSLDEISRHACDCLTFRARQLAPIGKARGGGCCAAAPACVCCPGGDDLGGAAGGPPTPARLTLLPSSESSIQGLLRVIASAQSRIDLMMYGWDDDATGREVAAALAARARAGVRVRVTADRTGYLIHNAKAAEGCCTFLDELRAVPNVCALEPTDAFFDFDHRKLAVIDDRIVWSGGMILTEVARRRWHNLAYIAEGPIVAQFADAFEEHWRDVGGPPLASLNAPPPPAPVAPNASVRLLRTDVKYRTLKETVYHAVDHARHHIFLENPYFTDEVLVAKLIEARKRGVDVHAILTLRGNEKRLNEYETLTANRLLRGGARVYLFPAMTHVKAMSADGAWSYIGTGNFDELSLRNNREIGLSVRSPAVTAELDQMFLRDMAVSEELTALLPRPKHWLGLELPARWY